ncbi:MAG: hypothetical protein ABIO86_04740 [Sphingomonas sp.]
MSDRPRWGIRTALISFVLSGIITSAFILIWPRQTIAQCIYLYDNDASRQLILGVDMTGCDEAIEEATKSGNVEAAALGASYFSLYKVDDRKYLYYLRRSIELGDNAAILQLVSHLLDDPTLPAGVRNVKNCPEVIGLLKKYKLHALTPNDESTSEYYQSQKSHFEDYRATCNPSLSKTNTGSGHVAHEQ